VKWKLIFVLIALAAIPAEAPAARNYISLTGSAKEVFDGALDGNTTPVITASSFGFQCGTGRPTNCPNVTWPTTIAQPGMIRLWDSQVQWHLLNRAPGSYHWDKLDAYLDAIAAHQPRDAMYTFGWGPCWDTKGDCKRGWGSSYPPDDLTPEGSPSFNTFVLALVTHCSPAGHCVKDYIKYWEGWNEANHSQRWAGSVAQLYQLMAPGMKIIRNKVPGALILTPPPDHADTDWMQQWLAQENKNGRISDIFSLHLYLRKEKPEPRFDLVQSMVNLKNSTTGWSNTPWIDSETNFDPDTYACDSQYSADDCIGQMVRWHLLHFAAGAQHLSWFYFNTTIGRDPNYSAAYHEMMQWLIGGHFTAACSANGNVYTCPFIEANGHRALFTWNPNGDSSYAPASQYVDYKTLSGSKSPVSGKHVTVGVKPIMLEAAN
jgi:hypothetical protein